MSRIVIVILIYHRHKTIDLIQHKLCSHYITSPIQDTLLKVSDID
jgi:hypothetical protein